jgi:SAM-dependent methyltransferase
MYIVDRGIRFLRGFLLSYGPEAIKKRVWDTEYCSTKWDFADNTVGDCVYPLLEKYAQRGSILDLGCGSGNTATELSSDAYTHYVGVDISAEALAKAAKRTEASGRANKNQFACADFLSFEPAETFDVILFRESMYHIPIGKIRSILDKYCSYLTSNGVFIVRMFLLENEKLKWRPAKMIEIIEAGFDVVEKYRQPQSGAAVIVFRPSIAVAQPKPKVAADDVPGLLTARSKYCHDASFLDPDFYEHE